jgi:hypothetical protein
VLNGRAAGGRAVLRRRRRIACALAEVPVGERAVLIRRYLQQVPGACPHIPAGQYAALDEMGWASVSWSCDSAAQSGHWAVPSPSDQN